MAKVFAHIVKPEYASTVKVARYRVVIEFKVALVLSDFGIDASVLDRRSVLLALQYHALVVQLDRQDYVVTVLLH